jgi:predicted transcriptional regulator
MKIRPLLEKIVERSAPGRFPSYKKAHVVKSLEIASKGGIGRASLGTYLGLSEGVVRTLVRRLVEEELIEVSPKGISISNKGERFLDEIHSLIKMLEVPNTRDTVGIHNYAVLVKGAFNKVRLGVEQRDAALLVGARGATTIVYKKYLWIPGMNRKPEMELSEFIVKNLSPEEEDVVIIGTGDTVLTAEIGALSAAIDLA